MGPHQEKKEEGIIEKKRKDKYIYIILPEIKRIYESLHGLRALFTSWTLACKICGSYLKDQLLIIII